MPSLSFWTRLKKFAERHERAAYLNKNHFDCRCPNCKTWQGNCGGIIGFQDNFPDDGHDACRCGHCERWFIMDARGMIAVPAKDQSTAHRLDLLEKEKANVSTASVA